ncbi:hypothetical protein CAPTEDRAFT_193512, partial [Capitella teleta]
MQSLVTLVLIASFVACCSSLIISGVGMVQGQKHFLEFYADVAETDISVYTVQIGSTEFTLPTASLYKGEFYYVRNKNSPTVETYLGMTVREELFKGDVDIQGDEPISLYKNSQ